MELNALEFSVMGLTIMNNTFVHFFIASIMLLIFLWATFLAPDKSKDIAIKVMYGWFVLVLISGGLVWTLVPFSIPLLIKSVGGIILFWVMTRIVRQPNSILFWSLFVAIAVVGLGLAFTQI